MFYPVYLGFYPSYIFAILSSYMSVAHGLGFYAIYMIYFLVRRKGSVILPLFFPSSLLMCEMAEWEICSSGLRLGLLLKETQKKYNISCLK